MPIPLAAMAVGAGVSVGIQFISDMLSAGSTQEKVNLAKQAKASMVADLVRSGMDPVEADAKAKEAIGIALETGNASTAGDYIFAAISGAALGAAGPAAMRLGGKVISKVMPKSAAKIAPTATKMSPTATESVADKADDVYRAGFSDPTVEARKSALRMGAGDSVSGIRSGGNIGYTPPLREVDEIIPPAKAMRGGNIGFEPKTVDVPTTNFTMRESMSPAFQSKARGDMARELVGDTGGYRMSMPADDFAGPSMAKGGELLTTSSPKLIGYTDRSAGGIIGEISGTLPGATPFPASVGRAAKSAATRAAEERIAAMIARKQMQEQIKKAQMENMFESQELLNQIGL